MWVGLEGIFWKLCVGWEVELLNGLNGLLGLLFFVLEGVICNLIWNVDVGGLEWRIWDGLVCSLEIDGLMFGYWLFGGFGYWLFGGFGYWLFGGFGYWLFGGLGWYCCFILGW